MPRRLASASAMPWRISSAIPPGCHSRSLHPCLRKRATRSRTRAAPVEARRRAAHRPRRSRRGPRRRAGRSADRAPAPGSPELRRRAPGPRASANADPFTPSSSASEAQVPTSLQRQSTGRHQTRRLRSSTAVSMGSAGSRGQLAGERRCEAASPRGGAPHGRERAREARRDALDLLEDRTGRPDEDAGVPEVSLHGPDSAPRAPGRAFRRNAATR